MKYSIQRTLVLGSGIGATLILVIMGFLADSLFTGILLKNFDEALLAKARVLMTLTEEEVRDDDTWGLEFEFAEEFMPEFAANDSPEYFQLRFLDGSNFERSDTLQESHMPFSTLSGDEVAFSDTLLHDGRKGRLVHVKFIPQIPEEEERTPERLANQKAMIITLARERETLNNNLSKLHSSIMGFSTVILIFILILFRFVIHLGFKPLSDIRHQIDNINADDLTKRLGLVNPPSELQSIQSQFNQLMIRLEEAFLREKQFSADVAHELRTPITELKSATEVALKWHTDAKLVHRTLVEAHEISEQMAKLVENLFALARCEADKISVNEESISLRDMVERVVDIFHLQIERKKINICKTQPDESVIDSDFDHLEMILINLISNAITHSPENSTVKIAILQHLDQFKVSISNEAPNLMESDLAVMFNRLWQKDQSRTPGKHSGLGLSLVKAFAQILELTTNVTLSNEKILTIEIGNLKKSTNSSQLPD